jgi:hypothetical protein
LLGRWNEAAEVIERPGSVGASRHQAQHHLPVAALQIELLSAAR